jgi:hypothetical protein
LKQPVCPNPTMSTTTTITSHLNSALPSQPIQINLPDLEKTADTELTVLSLFSAGASNKNGDGDLHRICFFPGHRFCLKYIAVANRSAFPSQRCWKLRRVSRKFSHPSSNKTSMNLDLPTKFSCSSTKYDKKGETRF